MLKAEITKSTNANRHYGEVGSLVAIKVYYQSIQCNECTFDTHLIFDDFDSTENREETS